jgi:endonuclease-3
LDLARLRRLPTTNTIEYLTSLPGVGMKTASCVLLFSLGRPVMPVDTHVHRVSRRLGWAPWNASPEKVQPILEALVPPRLVLSMHLLLVTHGRRLCKAGRPLCDRCPLRSRCAFGGQRKRERQRRQGKRAG